MRALSVPYACLMRALTALEPKWGISPLQGTQNGKSHIQGTRSELETQQESKQEAKQEPKQGTHVWAT